MSPFLSAEYTSSCLSRLVLPLARCQPIVRGRRAPLIVRERMQHVEEALRGFVGRLITGVVRALVQPVDDLVQQGLRLRAGRDPLLEHTARAGVPLLRRVSSIQHEASQNGISSIALAGADAGVL